MEIMLASLREERQQTYSCFLPIHPETGRVLYVPLKEVNAKDGTITFDDGSGRDWTLPVTGGHVKLQWKPDFGARWAALGVDFEMYGKDHSTNTPIYDGICEVLGGRAPNHMVYELFLDEAGGKISKSKGNGLTIDEWLEFAATRVPVLLHVPEAPDGEAAALGRDPEERGRVPPVPARLPGADAGAAARRTRSGTSTAAQPPASDMVVPFAMLLNLAAVSGAEDKATLWKYLRRYAPEASPETHPGLDAAAGHAVRLLPEAREAHADLPRAHRQGTGGDGGPRGAAARPRGVARPGGAADHRLRGGQRARVPAAPRLVQGALRGADRRLRGAALRRLRGALRRRGDGAR